MPSDQHLPTSLPSPSWHEWILWLLHRRKRVQVSGESMLPTLLPGDIVLVDTRAYRKTTPAIGEIVVAHHPYQKNLTIIKRIADITPEGRIVLHSDNPKGGTDSRSFGAINSERIIGRVTSRSTIRQ